MTTKTAPGTVLPRRPAPKALVGRRAWDVRPLYEPAIFAVVLSIGYFVLPSSWQYTLTIGVIYSLLATSLGILFGWTGTYTFGHAAFFGMGAYATALLRTESWNALLFLGLSAVVAAIAAVVIGLLGGRLVKVEFAMLTMIVGQIAYLLTFKIGPLGGDNGLVGITRGSVFGFDVTSNNSFWIYTIVVIAVVMGILRRINLSSFGASLNAIRDDPVKAASIGLPVKGLRLAAFTLSGAVAGLAGALFAQQGGIVTPDTLSFTFSGQIIIMAQLGGMYRFWGPAIGALIFQLLSTAVFGNSSNGTLYLGVILLVVVLVFPKGVLGLLERLSNRFPVLGRLRRGRKA